ncbi:hypothetical protein ACJ41O_009423 [Fusarium nematophilum]
MAKKKRQESGLGKRGERLERSLGNLGASIDSRYKKNLESVGREFALGDGTCRSELRSCLIYMEEEVIAVLDAISWGDLDTHGLRSRCSSNRGGVEDALVRQRGRILEKRHLEASNTVAAGPSRLRASTASTTSSSDAPPASRASGKITISFSRLASAVSKVTFLSPIPVVKWGKGWGRSRRAQEYRPAAIWQQGAGVAKKAVGIGSVGCPDCRWGHRDYPPDLIHQEP